jgi:hypothetical protein
LFLCLPLAAQIATDSESTSSIPLPKNPPFFSAMTAVWQQRLDFQDSMGFQGNVAEVEREEAQSDVQSPTPFHKKAHYRFDERQRLTERTVVDATGSSTMHAVFAGDRLRSSTEEHHPKDPKRAGWTDWQNWSYDAGQLVDYRAGHDASQRLRYFDFRYDSSLRLLGYQQESNVLVTTKISYNGPLVTIEKFDQSKRKVSETIQSLDDRGRVVEVRVSDLSHGELKPWYRTSFRYDGSGRVIEQKTDPYKWGDGDDYSPLPGRIVSQFEGQTKDVRWFDPDGKLMLHTISQLDRDGFEISMAVFDNSGKEKVGSEIFVDPKTHKSSIRPGAIRWEVVYDEQGNWTERRRWFSPADGGERILVRRVRQTINYR